MLRSLCRTALLACAIVACDGSNAFDELLFFNGPPAVIASVQVTPFQGSVAIGGTIQLTATLRDESGEIVAGPPIVWSSTQPTIAAVNSTGLVSGLSTGLANIVATTGTLSATSTVTVTTN